MIKLNCKAGESTTQKDQSHSFKIRVTYSEHAIQGLGRWHSAFHFQV